MHTLHTHKRMESRPTKWSRVAGANRLNIAHIDRGTCVRNHRKHVSPLLAAASAFPLPFFVAMRLAAHACFFPLLAFSASDPATHGAGCAGYHTQLQIVLLLVLLVLSSLPSLPTTLMLCSPMLSARVPDGYSNLDGLLLFRFTTCIFCSCAASYFSAGGNNPAHIHIHATRIYSE